MRSLTRQLAVAEPLTEAQLDLVSGAEAPVYEQYPNGDQRLFCQSGAGLCGSTNLRILQAQEGAEDIVSFAGQYWTCD